MRRAFVISCVLVGVCGAGLDSAAADTAAPDTAIPDTATTDTAAGPRVITSTRYIEAIAVTGDTAWVATRGGVEQYSISERRRIRLYTTLDGLISTHILQVAASTEGVIEARSQDHRCTLAGNLFLCVDAPRVTTPVPEVARMLEGARETARVPITGGWLVGTAGKGLWLDEQNHGLRAISPRSQVCSNHVMAMATFKGRLYLGSFDEGVCASAGDTSGAGSNAVSGQPAFETLDTPFRMVNDMIATPKGLYVASSSGLFVSTDGIHFTKVAFVTQRGVGGLAFDGRTLYATTPATLWRIRVKGGPKSRSYWKPGGSTAVQKVTLAGGMVWLASEDRGVIRFDPSRRGKNQKAFTVLDRAAGLPTSWIMDVAAGEDGILYAATFRDGLLRIDTSGKQAAQTIAGLPDSWLLHVSEHDGAIWIGTQAGAARIDGRRVSVVQHGLPHPCVHAVARFGGRTWLATEGGLYTM